MVPWKFIIPLSRRYFICYFRGKKLDVRGKPGILVLSAGINKNNPASFDKAIQTLEKALKELPNQIGALIMIGWAYISKQNMTMAEKAFRRAVAASPSFGEAHGGLATALAFQKRVKEAQEEIVKIFCTFYPTSIFRSICDRTHAWRILRQ